ncbi:MAG: phage portal protein [Candidatus Competibacteraceae bacterium]|nr:phage portal protein [Candidatus Competibacteraceae bacterium]
MFATSAAVYAAASFRARNISSIPMIVYDPDGKAVTPDDSLYAYIFRRGLTYSNLMKRNEISYCFFGYTLMYVFRNAVGLPVGLNWVNPMKYTIDADDWAGLRGFRINAGLQYQSWANKSLLTPSEVLFMHGIDLLDDFDGVAPAEAAYTYAEADAELGQTFAAVFRNMAIPALIGQPTEDYLKSLNARQFTEDSANKLVGRLRQIAAGESMLVER